MQVLNTLPESSANDIVVIGAGGAGLVAALFAALAGKSVLVVERTPFVGGTTALSAGTTWVPGTHHAATVNPTMRRICAGVRTRCCRCRYHLSKYALSYAMSPGAGGIVAGAARAQIRAACLLP